MQYDTDSANENVESPQPPIGVEDEDEDEDSPIIASVDGFSEDDIRRSQKINTVAALQPYVCSRLIFLAITFLCAGLL